MTTSYYTTGTGYFNTTGYPNLKLSVSSGTPAGDWIAIEMPYKLKLDTLYLKTRSLSSGNSSSQRLNGPKGEAPRDFEIWGTNDDVNWYLVKAIIDAEAPNTKDAVGEGCADPRLFAINATKSYKKFAMIVTRNGSTYSGATAASYITVGEMSFYGHRENDLVRLPDPTNVLKYPHIKITNTTDADGLTYAIRGYEFSRSHDGETMANWYDENTSNFTAFGPGNYNGSASGASGATTGTYNGSTNLGGTVGGVSGQIPNGEWHKIKMPHKILLSKLNIVPRIGQSISAPYEWRLYGSNDDSDWTLLYNKNDTSTIPDNASGADYSITTSTSFRSFAIVMIKSVNYAYLNVGEFNWYGTGVDSIPIQIGGGNIDKVANFRVYDKFVGEDQALEIWDAQKDEFGRAKSSMTLHKGRLGIGTTEPEGRLAVLDEPHNLEEFPPRAMTGYKTYFEGHGEFCVSASDEHSSNYDVQNAFNKITNRLNSSGGTTNTYYNGGEPTPRYYDVGNDYAYSGTSSTHGLGGVMGEWVKLKFPYKANISQISILPVDVQISTLAPEDFTIMGSSDDINWTTLRTVTGATWTAHNFNEYTLPSTTSYKYFALVVSRTVGANQLSIQEVKYFGTREQDQSTLHDGQLTLTKSLNVPRIGPALDADDTPRRDRLVVEYNTSTNPTFEGAVRDTSGRGNDGVMRNGATYDATKKSLEFPLNPATSSTSGNRDSIETGPILDGTQLVKGYSVSTWFRADSQAAWEQIWVLGKVGLGKHEGLWLSGGSTISIHNDAGGGLNYYYPCVSTGNWKHVTFVRNGTTASDHEVYVDGVKVSSSSTANGSAVHSFEKESNLILGENINHTHYGFDGGISNFKLYDVALTAEEVKTLYDMGRCDEGHHVVNFSKTRVGIGLGDGETARSTLDVRGGIAIGNTTGQVGPLHIKFSTDAARNSGTRFEDASSTNYWENWINNGDYFYFAYNGSDRGYIQGPGGAGATQMPNFTGQHMTFIKDISFIQAGELEGLIVSSDQNKYIKMSGGIEAGSNAITTNESLPIVSLSNVVTDKKCFGVISASEDPETRTVLYGAWGSVAEKEKGDTRVYINSVGEGAIWVVNTNGSLESGDYITTSNVAGYGQKQDDDILHNYTVAKITMDCDFNPATQPVQQILRSNVVETYYLGNVHHTKTVPHEFVTTVVGADDDWSNVSISPSDTTYAEWSNLEANTQNTYTLTYTQTSNVVYDTKYTLTTTANVTESDSWDRVYIDPPTVTYAEWSNLEANTQNTYTLTFTQTTIDEKTPEEWSALESNVQSLYNKVYYQSVEEEVDSDYPGAVAHTRVTDRIENELDEHGQIQWEDHPTETEKAYKVRYLDVSGAQTDEANAVHIAAFVGCTYHCG